MRKVYLSLLLLVVGDVPAQAQVQALKLGPPNARIDPGLKIITSVRELRDGRLLVTDPQGRGLVLIDFSAKTTGPVARRGRGPGEYGLAAPLHTIAGDSSLMADGLERRWI